MAEYYRVTNIAYYQFPVLKLYYFIFGLTNTSRYDTNEI